MFNLDYNLTPKIMKTFETFETFKNHENLTEFLLIFFMQRIKSVIKRKLSH